MHVIRDKSSHEVIFINYFSSGVSLDGKEIYPEYNADNMEIGWTEKTYIPANFDINDKGEIIELSLEQQIARGIVNLHSTQKLEKGNIVPKSLEEQLAEGIIELSMLKNNKIAVFSRQSFELRQQLIPDYQLHNAALGIYDEITKANYQATVAAFRDEFYRLKAAIERANDLATLEAITPNFPTQIVST